MFNNAEHKYPILEVNLKKLSNNVKNIKKICSENDIEVTGVIKGCNASYEVTETFVRSGCQSIASSRIDQLKQLKTQGIQAETMMLRLPMGCEIHDLVEYVDISLNSEKQTLDQINTVCALKNKKHKVILMYDLGDLREGVWHDDDFMALCEYVEALPFVELLGIGSNLGCYGSIRPTFLNLSKLVHIAETVETRIGRRLDVISGGATSSLPLVLKNQMPKRINHLRIGEGILLARDLKEYFQCDVDFLHDDTFTLQAQIIEIQHKPSFPEGEIYVDAFGNRPHYENKGIRKRALLAVGKQDFGDHDKLLPLNKNIEIVGSSSDHLIVDITLSEEHHTIGDVLDFNMFYQSMLYLSISHDVQKKYL